MATFLFLSSDKKSKKNDFLSLKLHEKADLVLKVSAKGQKYK